jgi:hypothetical protein
MDRHEFYLQMAALLRHIAERVVTPHEKCAIEEPQPPQDCCSEEQEAPLEFGGKFHMEEPQTVTITIGRLAVQAAVGDLHVSYTQPLTQYTNKTNHPYLGDMKKFYVAGEPKGVVTFGRLVVERKYHELLTATNFATIRKDLWFKIGDHQDFMQAANLTWQSIGRCTQTGDFVVYENGSLRMDKLFANGKETFGAQPPYNRVIPVPDHAV